MSPRCGRRAAITGALAVLAGCASPSPVLYTIATLPGAVQSGAPRVIVLQEVGLARYLERSQIVRSSENYRLDVESNNWWGEPLGAMLTRVLLEELGQRLPESVVLGENGAVTATADATVALTVQRLDEDAARHLVLLGQAGVAFGARGVPELESFRYTEPLPVPGVGGEVAAISTAVGQLADRLAATLAAGHHRRR